MRPSLTETAEYRPRIDGDRFHVYLADHRRVKHKQQIVGLMAQGLILGELLSCTTLYQNSAALVSHIGGDQLSMTEASSTLYPLHQTPTQDAVKEL